MHVHPVSPEVADGEVRRMYDEDLEEDGYIGNSTLLYSLNPQAYAAWQQLMAAVRDRMEFRHYELATIAAARAVRCRSCVSAHAQRLLTSEIFDRAQIEAMTRDFRTAGLEPLDVAIMSLADKVALHAYKVTPNDIEQLRRFGLNDSDIFNVALTAAARSGWSKSVDAMGCPPDEALADTNDLIELVELRPVSAET